MVIIKLLYGIAEAGVHWWLTYFKHYTDKLQIEISIYDLYLLVSKPTVAGFSIISIQIDDTLGLSNDKFANKESIELRFSAKEKQSLTLILLINFNRYVVSTDNTGNIQLRQKH